MEEEEEEGSRKGMATGELDVRKVGRRVEGEIGSASRRLAVTRLGKGPRERSRRGWTGVVVWLVEELDRLGGDGSTVVTSEQVKAGGQPWSSDPARACSRPPHMACIQVELQLDVLTSLQHTESSALLPSVVHKALWSLHFELSFAAAS